MSTYQLGHRIQVSGNVSFDTALCNRHNDLATKGPDRGTGIGLFMSKNIIEKSMNGSLTVRNTAVGAEFRIEV